MRKLHRKPWLLLAFALLCILTVCHFDKPEDREGYKLSYAERKAIMSRGHEAHSFEIIAALQNQGGRW